MTQERKQKQTTTKDQTTEEVQAQDVTNAELAESTEATLDNIDDVLDDQDDADLLAEIDGVLEENAEEFVAAYVQAGGE